MKFRQPGERTSKLIRAGEALGGFEIPQPEFDARREVNSHDTDLMEKLIKRMIAGGSTTSTPSEIELAEALQYLKPKETAQLLKQFEAGWSWSEGWDDSLVIAVGRLFPQRITELRKFYAHKITQSSIQTYKPDRFSGHFNLYPLMVLDLLDPSQRPALTKLLEDHLSEINIKLRELRFLFDTSTSFSAFAELAIPILLLAPELKERLDITPDDIAVMKKRVKTVDPSVNIYDIARVVQFLTYYTAPNLSMSDNGQVTLDRKKITVGSRSLPPRLTV